jgi:3'-5' exoribonuclease
VLGVEQRSGETPHSILLFGNASGRIPSAPFWTADLGRIAGITRGDAVQLTGEITQYRDRRQLKVSSIRVLPKGSVDPERFLPSVGDLASYWASLDRWRGEIQAPRIAGTLSLFFDDPGFRGCFERCPASVGGHHAAIGGLLRHTHEVATIARAVTQTAAADWDLVLAGVLLHDIGKLEAYTWNGCFAMTIPGALLGHVVLGSRMLDRRVRETRPAPCTEPELLMLQHLILSHHGKGEYGAPVSPLTLEAEVLHYADNASAKTASMSEALADPDNFPGDEALSARPIWQLDKRRVYRGKSDWGR